MPQYLNILLLYVNMWNLLLGRSEEGEEDSEDLYEDEDEDEFYLLRSTETDTTDKETRGKRRASR